MKRFAVLVSGRGSNMEALIKSINNDSDIPAEFVLVLSDRENAAGLDRARSLGVEARFADPGDVYKTRLTPEAEKQYVTLLKEYGVDHVFLAGFMRILKKGFLSAFPQRVINIHPSLLPEFPGLATHKRVLEAGRQESGCTVHFVDAGMDSGPIIAQVRVPVYADDSEETLAARVLREEHRLYPLVATWIAREELVYTNWQPRIFDSPGDCEQDTLRY